MVAAIKVGWLGFLLTLVTVYVPPLTTPHFVEAGMLPTVAASLMELGTMLKLLDPQCEPLLIMGDLNACTAALAPIVEG